MSVPESLPLSNASVDHPHLQRAFEKILEAIASRDTRQTALVIGPTGVGKTHLANRVILGLQRQFHAEMLADPQCMPVVRVSIPMNTDRGFSWANYYEEALRALGDPFPSFRNVNDARRKIAEAIAARRVRVVLVDELHHVLYLGTRASAKRQSEVLKSLAEKTGVKHIGFGTYDLIQLLRANGQLSRRTEVIHFDRYASAPDDMRDFAQILAVLDDQLSGLLSFRLVAEIDYLHQGCVGLIGVLRDWLVRAAVNSRRENESIISKEALAETVLPVQDRMVILNEALEGEASLTDTDEDLDCYQRLLRSDFSCRPNRPTEPSRPKRRMGEPIAKRGSLCNA